MKIDYLIIGQGLAGSLLAWELIKRQKKVIIVDNGKKNASIIAAGLINPVTGMRFVKSSHIDQFLPVAIEFYKQLSLNFHQSFYIEKPLLRVLRDKKELVACQKRLDQPEYQAYLSSITHSDSSINSEFGVLNQKKTGYLLSKPLLTTLKDFFISTKAYVNANINYEEINLTPFLQWRNIQPEKIIFCEGFHAINNPWFSWLPFQPVKGEIITATSKKIMQQNILNYGHWFIPLDSHQFRIGATFDRVNLNTTITIQAKQTLLESLKRVYPNLSIDKITNHDAGVRPTTLDKQPFVGYHPHYPELIFFNGFGAKGSLQIPWYCQRLADNLLTHHPLPSFSDIQRYSNHIS